MIEHIYGNWDSIKQFEPLNSETACISVPMNQHSKKNNLGLNVIWSAASESYTESIGPLMISRMHIPFVLLDFQQWALCFSEPLQEIRNFSQRLIAQKTAVFIRLTTSLASFFDETMEKQWMDQIHSILEGSQADAWEYLNFSFAHPYHNYYTSNVFIEKINRSYQTIREELIALLGAESSRIRLFTELPLESSQRKQLIQKNDFDGVYFPNVCLYPKLFLETCNLLPKKSK